MAEKKTGMSRDLIIHPGETIADVLYDRNISQSELAKRTGVSAAYVNKVISGKAGISANFAMALEYALGVPKSFWLNLQANYDAELLELNELETVTQEELHVFSVLNEVHKYFRDRGSIPVSASKKESVLALRKILQISDLEILGTLTPEGAFRVDTTTKTNPYVMGAWLRLCQIAGERRQVDTEFDPRRVPKLVADLKQVMLNQKADIQHDLSQLFSQYGIQFSIVKNFRGAPVQGYLTQNKNGSYQIALTIRGSYADIFWFTLFHELGHIVNGDINKVSKYIDLESGKNSEREAEADRFASDALLDPVCYHQFVERNDFSIQSIQRLADGQSVPPYVVIGRLQKEKHIEYNWYYSQFKLRYKWATS